MDADSIEEYLRYVLTEALIQNTSLHEYCHASAWRESSVQLEIPFGGQNIFTDALGEANADLLALTTTSRVCQLTQLSDSLRGAKQPSAWDDAHVLAARVILTGLADFDVDSDLRQVATLMFLRFRDVLVRIKHREWQDDIQAYVLERAQPATGIAKAFDEGLLTTATLVEALYTDAPAQSDHVSAALTAVTDLLHSEDSSRQRLEAEVELLRAERLLERGTRMLLVRSCNPSLFEEAVPAAKGDYERAETIARELRGDVAESAPYARLLRRLDAVRESRTMWSSPPGLVLRTTELILTGMAQQHKEAIQRTSSELQDRLQSHPLREALLELARGLEEQAYPDQETALQAASDWLEHAAESFTITAFTYCIGRLFLDACATDRGTSAEWCELVHDGRDEMRHVVRRFLSGQTAAQLVGAIEQNRGRLEAVRSAARAAVTASEWLQVLGRAVPLCLIEIEYVKALLEKEPDALADERIRALTAYGVQGGRIVETLAETTLRARPEQLWTALFDEPLLAYVRAGQAADLPAVIARLREGLVCIPDCVADRWTTISKNLVNGVCTVPANANSRGTWTEGDHEDVGATRATHNAPSESLHTVSDDGLTQGDEGGRADAASDAVMSLEGHMRVLVAQLAVALLCGVCAAPIGFFLLRGAATIRLDWSLMASVLTLWSVLVVQLGRFAWPGLLGAERKITLALIGVALVAVPLTGFAIVGLAGRIDGWWCHVADVACGGWAMLAKTKAAILSPGLVVLVIAVFALRAAQPIASIRVRLAGVLGAEAMLWVLPSLVSAWVYVVAVLSLLLVCIYRLLKGNTVGWAPH